MKCKNSRNNPTCFPQFYKKLTGSGSGPEPIFHDCFINRSENTVFIEKLVSKHENSFESKILEKRASSNSIAEPMPPSVK